MTSQLSSERIAELIRGAEQYIVANTPKPISDDVRFSLRDNYSVDELFGQVGTSFVKSLSNLISEKHLRDSEVYKAAGIDRRLFSKIMSDFNYKPSKDTCIAFSMALRLNVAETNDLLEKAGYVLSHSIRRDLIIEYLIANGEYDIGTANTVLTQMDEKQIGR